MDDKFVDWIFQNNREDNENDNAQPTGAPGGDDDGTQQYDGAQQPDDDEAQGCLRLLFMQLFPMLESLQECLLSIYVFVYISCVVMVMDVLQIYGFEFDCFLHRCFNF